MSAERICIQSLKILANWILKKSLFSLKKNPTKKIQYLVNLDQSLKNAAADKIRKYRADYNNNNPPSAVSFMTVIPSTSGRLHSEFVRLLFLQGHRETDRFFAVSGVQFAQSDRGVDMYTCSNTALDRKRRKNRCFFLFI